VCLRVYALFACVCVCLCVIGVYACVLCVFVF